MKIELINQAEINIDKIYKLKEVFKKVLHKLLTIILFIILLPLLIMLDAMGMDIFSDD